MKKQAQPFAAPVFWERHSQAAVISCVVGDFPVPLSIPIIASLRGHHASLSRPTRLSLAQGLNGQTEAGYISSSCPILLRPVVPSHLSCGQTSQPARHDSVFHLCRIEESHFCSVFRKGKKFLLSDGERGRSLIRGRMLTCSHLLPGRQSLDFLKPVIHIIITPSDNS